MRSVLGLLFIFGLAAAGRLHKVEIANKLYGFDETIGSGEEGSGEEETTPKPCAQCADGWTYITKSGFCYRLLLHKVNFDEARRLCHEAGAELASIHSQAEMSIIDSFTQERMWLGLRRDDYDHFHWTDNTVMDYSDWYEGEPNNRDYDERCAWRGRDEPGWNDVPCDSHARPLCKKPLV